LGFFEAINSRAEDANANNFYFLMCLKRDNFCDFYIDYLHHQKKQPQVQIKIGVFSKKNLKNPEKRFFQEHKKSFC